MNTDKLMGFAEQMVSGLYDGPQGQVEQLLCGLIYSQLAIANELKRMNEGGPIDRLEAVEERVEHLEDVLQAHQERPQ